MFYLGQMMNEENDKVMPCPGITSPVLLTTTLTPLKLLRILTSFRVLRAPKNW